MLVIFEVIIGFDKVFFDLGKDVFVHVESEGRQFDSYRSKVLLARAFDNTCLPMSAFVFLTVSCRARIAV